MQVLQTQGVDAGIEAAVQPAQLGQWGVSQFLRAAVGFQ